ncbi:MAG TPA: AI-2E family transporter [Devosia sp.]|nr:AI-2E family transporter [Devosia sp.]
MTVAVILVVIAGLYLGAGILVPLVLAILLAFALAPLVTLLEKLHVPDVLAVLLSVLLAGAVLGAFAYIATTQLMTLAADLPGYQSTVVKKIRDLQTSIGGGGFFERITSSIEALGAQVDGSANPDGGRAPGAPIPVVISNNAGNPLGVISVVLGSVLGPIATAAIVTIFLIFLLLGRDDLRDRFIRLVSRGNFSTTTLVIDDAAARVGRYLLVQFGVNVSYGIIFGTGLLLIGVPNAILWGLMAALFRYIPFVGTLIVASIPFALAFAVDPGWNMLVSAIALFAGLELITTNAIEPRLYGTSTGLSPLAVLLAAMFWATLWGPIGLILSTPLTVCLVVLGRYVPQLQFLETLLGSEPVLNQQERLYQRLLAGDTEEAIEISEELVEEKGAEALYSQYLLPALVQASTDLADGPASSLQRRRMATSLYALVEEYAEPSADDAAQVLLIGGKTELDESLATLLGLALAQDGIASKVLPPMAVRQESIGQIDLDGVSMVCLCYLGSDIRAQVRYAARRLRRINPDLVIVACHLNAAEGQDESAAGLRIDHLSHTLEQAQGAIRERLAETEAEIAELSEDNVSGFESAGRGNDALADALAAIADQLGVPVATINLLDDPRHQDETEAHILTQEVVRQGKPLVVHTAETKGAFSANGYLIDNGVEFYAAVPLTLADERTIGTLAIMDYADKDFSGEAVQQLVALGAELVERFGSKATQAA